MNIESEKQWDSMTREEKNAWLLEEQKETLIRFLEHGAISKAQYDKSLHDLIEKTSYQKK